MDAGTEEVRTSSPGARPSRGEVVALAVLLLLGLAGIVAARRHAMWDFFEPGPGLFPLAAAGLVAGCAVLALAVAAAARLRASAAAGRAPEASAVEASAVEASAVEDWPRLLVYAGIAILWPVAFEPLGFLLSSALALLVAFRIAERMAWVPSLLFAGGTVFAGWLLFERVLGVPLPRGLLAAFLG